MNKTAFALLYLLASSILNILFTAAIIGALFGTSFVVLRFIVHAGQETYATALFGSFTVGLVLSFFLYSKITVKIVKRYRLDEKFGGSKKKHPQSPVEIASESSTVLPPSALEDEEDEKWKE
ncbi:MAG: hypothetical protein J6K96_05120 [Treponema sp.]|nr:hypothetical protein [Treponema sp.]